MDKKYVDKNIREIETECIAADKANRELFMYGDKLITLMAHGKIKMPIGFSWFNKIFGADWHDGRYEKLKCPTCEIKLLLKQAYIQLNDPHYRNIYNCPKCDYECCSDEHGRFNDAIEIDVTREWISIPTFGGHYGKKISYMIGDNNTT